MSGGGTIVAVGDDVDLAIGQRVLGMTSATSGWFGEQAVLAAKDVTVIPDGVETTTAVAMHVTYGTSWFALHRRGNLQPGETVLVLAAAGGVGSSAVQTRLSSDRGCGWA